MKNTGKQPGTEPRKLQRSGRRICVGVVTRNRKQMFRELLESFKKMRLPADTDVIFAVVENDKVRSLTDEISDFGSSAKIFYELEEKLGIPFARNRVLEISLREGCDFTSFVDDDETVDPLWLCSLFDEMSHRDLDLIGGEVQLHPVDSRANFLQKLVWRGLDWRYKRIARRSLNHHSSVSINKVVITTNNWLIRNSFLRRTGLFFNESIGQSGGSDTMFFKFARSQGIKSGWSPKAIVFETVPLSRLSVRYQYRRGRDQAIASFRYKYPKATLGMIPLSLGFAIAKSLTSLLLVILALFTNGRTFTASVRAFGLASGRIQALLGRKSSHYWMIHGN
jgi:hypothetical protein